MSLNWLNDPLLLDAEPLPVNKWINANELLQQNRRDEIFQSNGQLNLYPIMVRKNDFIDETLFDILPEVNQKAKDLIGLFSTLTLERFLRYLRFIAVHPESIRESEIIIGDIFSKKKKTLKISGIPSHKVQLIDWRDIPNIHIIWEYLSIITNLQLLPNYMNPAHYIHRQGIFVKETSTDIAKRWLRKINPEIKEIDDEEFREIIDKLTESENLIASSLGIVLSYYSGFTARNLAVLIDDQKWLYNNFPYLLECLDNLPLNKTDFIEKAIETKNLFLISLALSKITNEFTCEEVLTFFKKLLIVLS
ncbi:MAG: hypothetical protein FK730_14825, partial [Asgard group archaeon]|nr:hypothetical protein [Asgard group archaeon]